MSRLPAMDHMGNPPAMPRFSSVHSNSSAFSASAGPNEDWTKISDLAERRRIQNRIAQRNYRKKLKRRLEDLERRAGSTSASPEPELQQHHGVVPSAPHPGRLRAHTLAAPPSATKRRASSTSFQHHHSLSSSYNEVNHFPYNVRQSPAPSSIFSQPSYTSAETTYTPSYAFSSSYPSPSVTAAEPPCYSAYLLPQTTTMPSMSASKPSAVKSEQVEDDLNNFAFGYLQGGYDLAKLGLYRDIADATPFTPPYPESTDSFADSFQGSIMGSPSDMWALYPSPPASITEDDPPIFSLPLDLALDEPGFFKSL